MPRIGLSNVSIKQLLAEIERRKSKLSSLIAQRDALDKEIVALQGLTGLQFATSSVTATTKRRGGRHSLAAAAASGKPRRRRKKYAVTAEQFVLDLVNGKGATTSKINAAWNEAGRTGRADNTLNRLFKAKAIKREPLPKGQKGSTYTLA